MTPKCSPNTVLSAMCQHPDSLGGFTFVWLAAPSAYPRTRAFLEHMFGEGVCRENDLEGISGENLMRERYRLSSEIEF